MASRATKRGLAIMSMTQGVVRVLKDENSFSRLDMMDDLEKLDSQITVAKQEYACDVTVADQDAIGDALKSWFENGDIIKAPESIRRLKVIPKRLGTAILITVSVFAMEDLMQKVNNKKRTLLLGAIKDKLEVYHDFIDPQGHLHVSAEGSDAMLDSFYKEINF